VPGWSKIQTKNLGCNKYACQSGLFTSDTPTEENYEASLE